MAPYQKLVPTPCPKVFCVTHKRPKVPFTTSQMPKEKPDFPEDSGTQMAPLRSAFLMDRLWVRAERGWEKQPRLPSQQDLFLEEMRQTLEHENVPALTRNSCSPGTESGTWPTPLLSPPSGRRFTSWKHGAGAGAEGAECW